MFSSIEAYLLKNKASDDIGASIYEHEITRALNHALANEILCPSFQDEYLLSSCTRVIFSSQSNWIDVMILMRKHECQDKKIIITYESDTDKFISATTMFGDPRSLDSSKSELPFALSSRSFSDTVLASSDEMQTLNSRRDIFSKAVIAALAPVMGMVSPAMAASTQYTSTPTTQESKSVQSPYSTSGVTTQGGDNDSKPDTKTDNVTDNKTDTVTDTRSDP